MSYNRVEINLLPPEFQPGPVVRYSLLINFVLIAGAITFIALNSVLYFWRLSDLHNQIKTLEQQKAAKESYVKDYQDLLSIQNQIGSYGRMICLTSSFYIDLPVVLDRVAKLIPDGVYLESISSARQSQTSTSSKVTIELNTSQRDPKLMEQTLRAFKSDPLLRECYMSSAEYKQQDITQLAAKHDVSWSAAGTEIDDGDSASSQPGSSSLASICPRPSARAILPLFNSVRPPFLPNSSRKTTKSSPASLADFAYSSTVPWPVEYRVRAPIRPR